MLVVLQQTYEENYHDSIHADECTVEMRQTTIKTWFKSNNPLGAARGIAVCIITKSIFTHYANIYEYA